jgi:hypothetical protein
MMAKALMTKTSLCVILRGRSQGNLSLGKLRQLLEVSEISCKVY